MQEENLEETMEQKKLSASEKFKLSIQQPEDVEAEIHVSEETISNVMEQAEDPALYSHEEEKERRDLEEPVELHVAEPEPEEPTEEQKQDFKSSLLLEPKKEEPAQEVINEPPVRKQPKESRGGMSFAKPGKTKIRSDEINPATKDCVVKVFNDDRKVNDVNQTTFRM